MDTRLKPLHLFFDKCLGTSLSTDLHRFYESDMQAKGMEFKVCNLIQRFAEGSEDRDWLTQLKDECNWIVVTCDNSKDPSTEKLREICKELKRTHVVFTSSLDTTARRKEAMTALWRFLRWIPYLPEGTAVKLTVRNLKESGTFIHSLEIEGQRIDLWCKRGNISLPPSLTDL